MSAQPRTRGERAVAGAISIVLVLGLGFVATKIALGAFDSHYRVQVVLGRIGQGVVAGTDVRMRGVLVGEVEQLRLDDQLRAVADLVLDADRPVPQRAQFRVNAKTLLGEKQIDIAFAGPVTQGPFVAAGGLVDDPQRVVEFQDVLADLAELFAAINPDDLAVLVDDGLGAFDNQGETIARAVDQGARVADLGASLLDDQVPATRDLSLVAEALGGQGEAFNRLGAELLRGLPTLSDNQAGVRVLADELSRFSGLLDATLTVDRANLDRLIINGDSVTRMLFAYTPEVGELIAGLTSYTQTLSGIGFTSPDITGEAGRFVVFVDSAALSFALCTQLPPDLTAELAECDDTPNPQSGGVPAPGPPPAPAPGGPLPAPAPGLPPGLELPLPPDLLTPQLPVRAGLGAVMDNALGGGAR